MYCSCRPTVQTFVPAKLANRACQYLPEFGLRIPSWNRRRVERVFKLSASSDRPCKATICTQSYIFCPCFYWLGLCYGWAIIVLALCTVYYSTCSRWILFGALIKVALQVKINHKVCNELSGFGSSINSKRLLAVKRDGKCILCTKRWLQLEGKCDAWSCCSFGRLHIVKMTNFTTCQHQ